MGIEKKTLASNELKERSALPRFIYAGTLKGNKDVLKISLLSARKFARGMFIEIFKM